MTPNEANIDIIRRDNNLVTVSVAMPVWDKPSNDGFISIDIPMFGIKTFAESDKDANSAIEESIRLFCMSAEKFGRGLEFELVNMGWNITSDKDGLTCMSFSIPETFTVIEQIMHTGDQFAKRLEIA